MSSMLREWFAEAKAEGMAEGEAVRAVGRRLGEDEETVRRLLAAAGQKLGAPQRERPKRPAEAPAAPLDAARARAEYRARREGGLDAAQAIKATARALAVRPHDVRGAVGVTEYELQHPPDSSHSQGKETQCPLQ